MDQIRIIKKYPNRRLYDTAVSRYITLDEIKELVLKHVNFKIIDARSEEDMTDYVLLQIITEHESGQTPIFTTEILQNIIRFYGNPLQQMFSQVLEKSFSSVIDKDVDYKGYFQNMMGADNPFKNMAEMTKQNMALWQETYSKIFNNQSHSEEKTSDKSKTKKKKPQPK